MSKRKKTSLLIVGLPRSGTTWLANVLAQQKKSLFIHEPDNEKASISALIAKWHAPRFPFLTAQSQNEILHFFWQQVFQGKIKSNNIVNKSFFFLFHNIVEKKINTTKDFYKYSKTNSKIRKLLLKVFSCQATEEGYYLIIKSVHAVLCLDFLYNHFQIQPLIIFRHPANIISSHLKLNMPDSQRFIFNQSDIIKKYITKTTKRKLDNITSPLTLMGFQIALVYKILEDQLGNHPTWIKTTHEELCKAPVIEYKKLVNKIGFSWDKSFKNFINTHNAKPQQPHQIKRLASEEINKWKKELSNKEIKKIQKGYSMLPVNHYSDFRVN